MPPRCILGKPGKRFRKHLVRPICETENCTSGASSCFRYEVGLHANVCANCLVASLLKMLNEAWCERMVRRHDFPVILWMDETLHHLRNPGMIRFPVNTNKPWFPLVSKRCKISSTKKSIKALPFRVTWPWVKIQCPSKHPNPHQNRF